MLSKYEKVVHFSKKCAIMIMVIATILSVSPHGFGCSFLAHADEGVTVVPPSVTVIGTTIKNSKDFFELGLEVDPGSFSFSTTGIVLGYDKSVITPVSWDEDGTEVTMGETSDWQHVAAIPAVAPTTIGGKHALSYAVQSSEETQEENSENPSGASEKSPAYLYLSSEATLPISSFSAESTGEGEDITNTLRTITVRFKYVGETDEDKALNKAKVVSGFENNTVVWLADDEVSALSPAGQVWVYDTGADAPLDLENATPADETNFYYTFDNDSSIGLKFGTCVTAAPKFKLVTDGDTANSGGSDPSKFAALVFFDWDESTLLGSVVVDGSASSDEINEQISTFTTTLLPPGFTLPTSADVDLEAGETLEGKLHDVTEYNTSYPLTSKNGYTFGKWIDFESEAFTIYGSHPLASNAGSTEVIATPADPDYSNMSGGKVLKAAYISNALMDEVKDSSTRTYTVANSNSPDTDYYGRYGTSDSFMLKFDMSRLNDDGNVVQRTRETAVRVKYTIGETEIYSLIDAQNIDNQTVEVAAPKNADSVSVVVIDVGGLSDWVTGPAERSKPYEVKATKNDETDDLGYIIYGTVNYINEQIAEAGATTFSSGIYKDAGLTVGTATAKRRQAATNIRTAQQSKFEATGIRYLSYDEMDYAVKNSGAYIGS